jgi:hypothetical protein
MGLQLSGSVQLEGNLLVTGSANSVFENISVTNRITANEINVQFVSSSIIYSSGSNKFGDEAGDVHQFTGSVDVSGSLAVGGVGTFAGSVATGGNITVTANSAAVRVTESGGADIRMVAGGSSGFFGTYSNHPLIFLTNSENKLTLSTPGNLGLGVTPSAGWVQGKALEVGFVGTSLWGRYANESHLTMNYYYSTSANARLYASTDPASDYEQFNGNHTWYSAPSGTANTAVNFTSSMSLTAAGNLNISNGNLVIGTAGKGIDFSATSDGSGTTTSELLDDYEEGTWTGTLKGSVSDPSTPVTATGYYTKVGNKVFATIAINNATTTGASGIVTVSGLPFTSASTNNSQGSVMCTFYDFNGGTSLVALLGASSSEVSFLSILDDGDWNDVLHVAGSGRSLRFSITYFV